MVFKKGHKSFLKNKTYEEVFGEKKAKEIKRKLRENAKNNSDYGMKNKHHSPETITKMKIAQLGEKNYAYGTHHTKEWKENMKLKIKETWQNPKIREKRIEGLDKVRNQIAISKKITSGTYGETEEMQKKRVGFYKKKWKINNPKKVKAHHIAYNIEIPENQLCEECNKNKAEHRHHEDYSKPLEIKFLCASCHSKLSHIGDLNGY